MGTRLGPGRAGMMSWPDARGYYGPYGGSFVPETLMAALAELTLAYEARKGDGRFLAEWENCLNQYAGRPSPLYYAAGLSRHLGGGVKVYLKREDLNHTGSHKINNTLGQILLARQMGKTRVVAETGAGQHGVATATVAARFGLECAVYMGEEDVARQSLNVFRMRLLGSRVVSVASGSRTLKDAMNEAMRDWVANVRTTFYLIGSVAGPHPYPMMVRDFQTVIGRETRRQILEQEGRLPDRIIACVGGGSNSMGIFHPFLNDRTVRLTGVEAGGLGLAGYPGSGCRHAATLGAGRPGVLHGSYSYILQDGDGQVSPVHSISAGLDYPGVGPEHGYLKDTGRVDYVSVTDEEALAAFALLCRTEGIIPALESSHAVAHAVRLAPSLPSGSIVVVNLSGRGDKDVQVVAEKMGVEI